MSEQTLVERLRYHSDGNEEICDEAAARIEELEAKITAVDMWARKFHSHWPAISIPVVDGLMKACNAAAEAAKEEAGT